MVREGVVVGMLRLLSSSDSEVAHLSLTFIEMVLKYHPQVIIIIIILPDISVHKNMFTHSST